jgi:hypothetical protein
MSSILLISDEELVVESLQDDLNKLGYKVRLKKMWDWETNEETDEDYENLQKSVFQRKNPAILKRLLNNEI